MIDKLFLEYKEITREISSRLRSDEEPIELMKKREEILKQINEINVSPEEKKQAYINADVEKYDIQLKKTIECKMKETKEKIKRIKVGRQAFKGYMSQGGNNNSFSIKR